MPISTRLCLKVMQQLGIPSDTLRGWVQRADIDGGLRPGRSTDDAEHIANLEREVREQPWRAPYAPAPTFADESAGVGPPPSWRR